MDKNAGRRLALDGSLWVGVQTIGRGWCVKCGHDAEEHLRQPYPGGPTVFVTPKPCMARVDSVGNRCGCKADCRVGKH